MKIRSTIAESFFTFVALLIIVLISMGMQWEERRSSIEYFTWELREMLDLSESQAAKIGTINYQYYDAITHLELNNTFPHALERLQDTRNQRMLEVFNAEQRKRWKSMSE